MNRRVFLRGVGGAAVAAPFLPSLYEKAAKAQDDDARAAQAPRHLLHTQRLPDEPLVPEDHDRTAPLPPTRPAGGDAGGPDAVHEQAAVPARVQVDEPPTASGQSIDPHDQACGSKLTCATIDAANKRYATAASLDHVIAKQINPGAKAPLVLSVGAASTSIKEVISFSGPGVAFPATVNPTTVYNQLTGVFGTGPGTTGAGRHLAGQARPERHRSAARPTSRGTSR